MKPAYFLAILALGLLVSSSASAAFLVEAHQSGLAWENFAFGGDTFSAGSSNAASEAVGLTAETSIFGGDGVAFPDTYTFSYTPGEDDDNVTFVAGTILGSQDGSPGLGFARRDSRVDRTANTTSTSRSLRRRTSQVVPRRLRLRKKATRSSLTIWTRTTGEQVRIRRSIPIPTNLSWAA